MMPVSTVPPPQDFVMQMRVRYLRVLMISSLIVSWAVVIYSLLSPTAAFNMGVLAATVIIINVTAVLVFVFLSQGAYHLASTTVQVALVGMLLFQGRYEVIPMMSAIVLVIGAFLFDRTPFIILSVVVALFILLHFIGFLTGGDNKSATLFAVEIVYLTVIGISVRFFADTVQNFALRNSRNNDLLRATAEVGQIVGKILDTSELFQRSIELVRDRFAYYHVQIFMVDEDRKFARLVASTGEVGKRLLERQHRLGVGSQSVIGRVAQVGEPIIARDTDRDPLHARNELLPNTRSELALPIFDGDRIIGALDVQSTRSNAFQPADIQALQVMANQIGTAIRNARLFEAQSASVQENKRLFFESEANLREIQRLNRQLTQRSWRDFVEAKGDAITGLTVTPDSAIPNAAWSATMSEASRRRRPTPNAEQGTLAVPIVLRGEVIGAIEVSAPDNPDDEDRIEMVQSVAQRLAISLDNARLFEEAQQRSIQEQRLNEIVERYQSALSVDELLQITLSELSDVFGAEQGRIRLGKPPTQSKQTNGAQRNGDASHE